MIQIINHDINNIWYVFVVSDSIKYTYKYNVANDCFYTWYRKKWMQVDEDDAGVVEYFRWRESRTN